MDLRHFFNSAETLRFGLWLGRHLSPGMGYRLADTVTGILAQRQTAVLQTLHGNLRMVLGPEASEAEVHATAARVLHHAGRVYFDLYHALATGPEAFLTSVRTTPLTDYYLDRMQHERHGCIVVGPHLSNFDLAALALVHRGLRVTALAHARPTSGYDLLNQIRGEGGLEMIPIDVKALRRALEALRQGDIVATGVDRPDPTGGGQMLPFFGHPARLPVGHVRLALQADVPIVIASCEFREPEQTYVVHFSRWMEMERTGNRDQDIRHNALRILHVFEGLISAHPEQWMMFYPVWEDQLGL